MWSLVPPEHEETTMPDHHKLGRELGLFGTDPLIGAGLPYWLPDGALLRHTLEEYIRGLERRAGYQHVYSPVLGKRELYEISGHWRHYQQDMFPPMRLGDEEVVLRPSLCPHHAVIFRSRGHSYRELPVRLAELGGMYRSELSGVLGGLTRVRAIQLNDAHIFCALDQVGEEVTAALVMIQRVYQDLGIEPASYRLSLPASGNPAGGKYVAAPEMWHRAAAFLTDVLDAAGLDYAASDGEAAFYGPKIDVQVADHAGRETTLSTIQVDLYQPAQFGLAYTGPDGARHQPVMVHRSVLGSIERAVAYLIERHGGAFPPWLAPTQLLVLPIAQPDQDAAAQLAALADDAGLRVRVAGPDRGSLAARVRADRLVPYQAVIGEAERAADAVALRLRDGRRLAPQPVGEALGRIKHLIEQRGVGLWEKPILAESIPAESILAEFGGAQRGGHG
ncbi:threonine--tRNA ligase [Natronosporangium hydrolyticum]